LIFFRGNLPAARQNMCSAAITICPSRGMAI
jgi:hypothetical protein